MSCIFCKILAGEVPASFVYRDAEVAAFMDIQPVNPGHLLIVPIVHTERFEDLLPAAGAGMFAAAQRLTRALKTSGLRCEGVNLSVANGAAAGQEVFHVHLHVIPRFPHDGFGHTFPAGYSQKPPASALAETARQIERALERTK